MCFLSHFEICRTECIVCRSPQALFAEYSNEYRQNQYRYSRERALSIFSVLIRHRFQFSHKSNRQAPASSGGGNRGWWSNMTQLKLFILLRYILYPVHCTNIPNLRNLRNLDRNLRTARTPPGAPSPTNSTNSAGIQVSRAGWTGLENVYQIEMDTCCHVQRKPNKLLKVRAK